MKIKRERKRLLLLGASVKDFKEYSRAKVYKRRARLYRDIAADMQEMYLRLYMKCSRLTAAHAKGLDTAEPIKEIADEIRENFPVPY